jgi:predicted transcriptional regulator of viral defense system
MKKPNLDQLYEIACRQQGFITAHQATECGYSRQLQVYYVRKGEWIRHARSIFKLLCFSEASPFPDEYYVTLLWSENQQGEYEGVIGYSSALFVHGLIEKAPEEIHFIVPKKFRRNSPSPGRIRFHRRDLQPEFVDSVHGLKVMTVFATVRDLLMRNSLDDAALNHILNIAVEKNKLTIEEIEQLASQIQQKESTVEVLRRFIVSAQQFQRGTS